MNHDFEQKVWRVRIDKNKKVRVKRHKGNTLGGILVILRSMRSSCRERISNENSKLYFTELKKKINWDRKNLPPQYQTVPLFSWKINNDVYIQYIRIQREKVTGYVICPDKIRQLCFHSFYRHVSIFYSPIFPNFHRLLIDKAWFKNCYENTNYTAYIG